MTFMGCTMMMRDGGCPQGRRRRTSSGELLNTVATLASPFAVCVRYGLELELEVELGLGLGLLLLGVAFGLRLGDGLNVVKFAPKSKICGEFSHFRGLQ